MKMDFETFARFWVKNGKQFHSLNIAHRSWLFPKEENIYFKLMRLFKKLTGMVTQCH